MKDNQTPNRYIPAVQYSSKRKLRAPQSKFDYQPTKQTTKLKDYTAYSTLNIKERAALADAIAASISELVFSDRSVYLPGLGLFSPLIEEARIPSIVNGELLITQNKTLSVDFEKCADESSLSNKAGIVQWYDLALKIRNESAKRNVIFPTVEECKAAVISFVSELKHEITVNGSSRMLGTLGQFCALHNRQGESEKAWFEGADVFLVKPANLLLDRQYLKRANLPVLDSAWEPLEAAYGKSVSNFEIDLVDILEKLEFDTNQLKENELGPTKIRVAVFFRKESNSHIFCTDGLRSLARRSKKDSEEVFGTEITVNVPSSDLETVESLSNGQSWVSFQIALGWMLMQATGSRTIKTGAAFSVDVPFRKNSKLSAVFGKELPLSPIPQQCSDGFFKYIGLTGITADELAAAEATSSGLLEAFLQRRGLLVETRINRSSVLRTTALTPVFH